MKKILPVLVLASLLSACSTKTNDDPLEPLNRQIFEFNQVVDSILLRPVAEGYRYVAPQGLRDHIGNIASNLGEPLTVVNSLLQGDIDAGARSFWRFIINSTVGLGGINDVATTAGITERDEDLGQTLAVWGIDSGPYLVLPLLGPSNGRDAVGRIGDWFINPVTYVANDTLTSFGIAVGRSIVAREQLLDPIDDINASSLDPYVTFRSIYQQRREALINNTHSDVPSTR